MKITWTENYWTNVRELKTYLGSGDLQNSTEWENQSSSYKTSAGCTKPLVFSPGVSLLLCFLAKEKFSIYLIQRQWPLLWLLSLNVSGHSPACCSCQLIFWLGDTVTFTLCRYLLLANVVQRDIPCQGNVVLTAHLGYRNILDLCLNQR